MPKFDYTRTRPYRLGKLYKELGEMLMDPKTDMRDIAAFGVKHGFDFKFEIVPDDDSDMNGLAA